MNPYPFRLIPPQGREPLADSQALLNRPAIKHKRNLEADAK